MSIPLLKKAVFLLPLESRTARPALLAVPVSSEQSSFPEDDRGLCDIVFIVFSNVDVPIL